MKKQKSNARTWLSTLRKRKKMTQEELLLKPSLTGRIMHRLRMATETPVKKSDKK
jgi:hypothetical protein